MKPFADIDIVLAIFGLPGGGEWIVLLILGLLIFGRRLPEVGRSIGKSIVEFKRGIKDIESDVDEESSRPGLSESRREKLPPTATSGLAPDRRAEVATPRADPLTPEREESR